MPARSQPLNTALVHLANSMDHSISIIGELCQRRLRDCDDTKEVRHFLRSLIDTVKYNQEQLIQHMATVHTIINEESLLP